MRRRIQRPDSGTPAVNDKSHNNAIFHVRTHHDRELARLTKGTKEATPAVPVQQNMVLNRPQAPVTAPLGLYTADNISAVAGRRTRREVGLKGQAAHMNTALVPNHQQQQSNTHNGDGNNIRVKFHVFDDTGGDRPTKILATLAGGASLQTPEGVVKLTRNNFHTPTIREIGSNDELCKLSNSQDGGIMKPLQKAPNLWNESLLPTSGFYGYNTEEPQNWKSNVRAETKDYTRPETQGKSRPETTDSLPRVSSRRHKQFSENNHEPFKRQKPHHKEDLLSFEEGNLQMPFSYAPPSPQQSTMSSSNSDQKSEDSLTNNNESGSNFYGSPDHQTIRRPPERPPRGPSILKAPGRSLIPAAPLNNFPGYAPSSVYYPPFRSPLSFPLIRHSQQPCATCKYAACATCRTPTCIVCMAAPCKSCAAPLCAPCTLASISTYNAQYCITCAPQEEEDPPCPTPPQCSVPLYYPPCDIPPYSPCDFTPPFYYNTLPTWSPHIDWAARRNLPPVVPNYVCETVPCDTTSHNAYQPRPTKPNTFLELFSKKPVDSARECPSCCRLQDHAAAKDSLMCPDAWVRCAVHTPRCDRLSCCEKPCVQEATCCGTLLNVIWIVVPVILFYVLVYFGLVRLIALNKFTRLAAVMANTTLLYIITLEPDDLIVYPTDKPKVKQAPPPLPPPNVGFSPSSSPSCELFG